MRASPALTLTVERFTSWRVALGIWLAGTAAALCAWAWLLTAQWGIAVWGVAPVSLLGAGWVAARLASTEPVRLHWDQQCWHCGIVGAGAAEPASGALDVTVDLGTWMMLRFTDRSSRKRRWIAVQRSGLEGQWHALRCAVYSPRPVAGGLPDDASDLLHGAASGASHRASPRIDPAA